MTALDSFDGRRADHYTYINTDEGIHAVPSLILIGKYLLQAAQPLDLFGASLSEALEDPLYLHKIDQHYLDWN